MKIAVLSHRAHASRFIKHFATLGAEIVVFYRDDLDSLLQEIQDSQIQDSQIQTISFVKAHVIRVHKRFLNPLETIKNHTRFLDLFRVVYCLDPKENILKQMEENPEAFSKLGPEVIESLATEVESYKDFDVVVNFDLFSMDKNEVRFNHLGPGGVAAVNELKFAASFKGNLENDSFANHQTLFISGSEFGNKPVLHQLFEMWKWHPHLKFIWQLSEALEDLTLTPADQVALEQFKLNDNALIAQFEKDLHEFRSQPDYIQAKLVRPQEPSPILTIYAGFEVSNLDKLLDQAQYFATLECPSFRKNVYSFDLKTVACDGILIFKNNNTYEIDGIFWCPPKELGLFHFDIDSGEDFHLRVESELMNFFSASDDHENV